MSATRSLPGAAGVPSAPRLFFSYRWSIPACTCRLAGGRFGPRPRTSVPGHATSRVLTAGACAIAQSRYTNARVPAAHTPAPSMDVVFGSSSAFAQTVPKPQLIRSSTPPPGEMAALIHAFDWSKSGIGPMARWPESLRTAVNLALGSRFPMLVWCGPDLLMIYNDAYRQLIGDKHPVALGSPGKEALAEIWHIVGPMLQGVMETGEATWAASEMFLLDRHGYAEECYFTFSLSPIVDERGRVAGVFTPVTEMTEKVIGERRLKTLHDLGVWGTRAADAHGACALAAGVLEGNLRDVPFALIYMADPDRSVARLAASAAISREAE